MTINNESILNTIQKHALAMALEAIYCDVPDIDEATDRYIKEHGNTDLFEELDEDWIRLERLAHYSLNEIIEEIDVLASYYASRLEDVAKFAVEITLKSAASNDPEVIAEIKGHAFSAN